jgi:hypothetical protein
MGMRLTALIYASKFPKAGTIDHGLVKVIAVLQTPD